MATIHKIHVGPGGTFEASGDFVTTTQDVDQLFEHLKTSSEKAISVHFHGGLVKEADGVSVADMMQPVYEDANNYALSFVWETGLVETFEENLARIHRTKLFQKLLKWVIKRAAERFGGFNARGTGVPVPNAEIDLELQKNRPFDEYDDDATGKGAARGGDIATNEASLVGLQEELEAEFEELIDEDDEIEQLLIERDEEEPLDASQRGIFSGTKVAIKLAKITFRVIRRHVRDRDHGFYPTIVEEIVREYYLADLGAWVWGGMKDKAGDMWASNEEVTGEEQHVGTYVLDALAELLATRDIKVNLIGHSAGAIVICELLAAAAARHPDIHFNDIVFLAPAVRSEVAVSELAEHPDRYVSFRQFTMSDRFERDDTLIPGIYTRSLLYLISGILEPEMVDMPIAGMMRHASGEKPFNKGPAKKWASFLARPGHLVLADSTVLSPDAGEGERTAARKHGAFDNDALTQESLTHRLKV